MIYISSLGARLSGGPLKISIVTSAPLTVAVHSGSATSVPEEPGSGGPWGWGKGLVPHFPLCVEMHFARKFQASTKNATV